MRLTAARWTAALSSLLALTACGDDPGPGGSDAGAPADLAAPLDAGASPDAGPAPAPDAGVQDGGARTVYFVIRHTERNPGVDPPINAEGEGRAVRLADALEGAGIDEIITTSFIRGQQSGQPLADRRGLEITVAPVEPASWPIFGEEVAAWQRAREQPGRTYLLIGHAGGYNSALLRGLGADFDGTRAERYQDLAVLIREPDGAVHAAFLQYGGPSSLDP